MLVTNRICLEAGWPGPKKGCRRKGNIHFLWRFCKGLREEGRKWQRNLCIDNTYMNVSICAYSVGDYWVPKHIMRVEKTRDLIIPLHQSTNQGLFLVAPGPFQLFNCSLAVFCPTSPDITRLSCLYNLSNNTTRKVSIMVLTPEPELGRTYLKPTKQRPGWSFGGIKIGHLWKSRPEFTCEFLYWTTILRGEYIPLCTACLLNFPRYHDDNYHDPNALNSPPRTHKSLLPLVDSGYMK